MYSVGIVTISDKGSRGERVDESGRVLAEMVSAQGWEVAETRLISDDFSGIVDTLIELCDRRKLHLVLTTGGTGFGERDNTPEATLEVIERLVPGLPEAIRAESAKITPRAYLSRGVAGIRKHTLIVNLPGSPKAVKECLAVILPALPHGLDMLTGHAHECAQKE
ncbi:MAG: MogA/MoaB family molybdenum cofactor biosynthesis protein [Bacillota bacterium]